MWIQKNWGYIFGWTRNATPQRFIEEASKMGISKRIGHIPRGIELGKTWVLLAHKEAGARVVDSKETLTGKKKVEVPAIFYAFRPQRVEKIITEKQAKNKKLMKELAEKGVTPVVVDAKDEDHQGTAYDDLKKEKTAQKTLKKTKIKWRSKT